MIIKCDKMDKDARFLAGVLLVLAAMMMVQLAGAQSSTTPQGALSLTNLVVSPQPVVSGENITITFGLYNSYGSTLNNVDLQLLASSQLINVSPSDTYLIDGIGTGSYGGAGYDVFTYKVHVPSTLQEGVYTIDVIADYQTTQSNGEVNYNVAAESVMPINIYVYGVPQISLNALPSTQIIPGHQFTMDLSAVNSGSGQARDVSLRLLNSSSFSADGAEEFNLGIIPSGASQEATVSLFAAANISGGTNVLPVQVNYTSDAGISYNSIQEIPINILLNRPDIVASIVGAVPTELSPGSNQTETIAIQNIGTGQANNVSVQFLNGSGVSASGSASSFFIGSLPQNAQVTETVFVSANRYANQTDYSLPVTISYTYANYGNSTVLHESIPIKVQSGAIFNITAISSSLLPGSTYRPVTVTVKNIGNEEAQQITLSLQSIYPITPVTPDAYLESLSPGQQENVTFYVSVSSSGKPGTYPITLYEQWRQPDGSINQQYSGSNSYYAQVGGAGGSGYTYTAVLAVVVVVVIVAAYRFGMKRIGKKRKA